MQIRIPPGATPIQDVSGLIPRHITTQEELNELEFANINQALKKYFLGNISDTKAPFTVEWLYKVHWEMYGEVWSWAGKKRISEFNIGIPVIHIDTALKQLLDNFRFWIEQTKMDPVEIATRLHHGLVRIHPFRNGNGRWARLICSIYLRKNNLPSVDWPEENLREDSLFRKEYIDALKKADENIFEPLVEIHRRLLR